MNYLRPFLCFWVSVLSTATGFSQRDIDKTLDRYNRQTVPYVSVDELKANDSVVLLDTRTWNEFSVSHLKNARWVGHKKFDADSVIALIPDRQTPIVVYCSIGVRSEDIGEKLQKMGYAKVKNLYGGIFEWKNQGNPVFDLEGRKTEKVHAFSRYWGKLLKKGEKVH